MVAVYKHKSHSKPVLSRVLLQENRYDWKLTKEEKPEDGTTCLIRLCNNDQIVNEDDLHVYVNETLKIAKYKDNKWEILPPHPLFDSSELSHNEFIYLHTEVSHWTIPSEKDINDWNSRFDIIGKYKEIKFEVAESDAELIFMALAHGYEAIASLIGNEINNPSSIHRKYYEVLYDLQNMMKIISEDEYES